MDIVKIDAKKMKIVKLIYEKIKYSVENADLIKIPSDLKFWIAGSSVSSIYSDFEPNDYDVYSNYPEKLITILSYQTDIYFSKSHQNFQEFSFLDSHSPEFDFLSYTIQIIKKKKPSNVEEILNEFDFTCCCAAYDGETIHTHFDFYEHIKDKKLVINHLHSPIYTFKRALKYSRRGFFMSDQDMLKIVKAINSLDRSFLDNVDLDNIQYDPIFMELLNAE